jgi:TPR repeat protein
MEIALKTVVIVICSIFFFALLAPVSSSASWKEDQAKADQLYESGEYKKAFKQYVKLGKMGVSHSQDMVSKMYENGEGTKVNLVEAYAWSVLAAQRGAAEKVSRRDSLLEQNSDQKAAEKKANKLMSKYGRAALQKRADSKAKLKHNTKSGGCTGSKLGCR